MSVTAEAATVYRGGGRRWLHRKTAIKAEAIAIIKRKHPSEKPEYDPIGGRSWDAGWHWRDLPRSDVLLRRVMRLVERSAP